MQWLLEAIEKIQKDATPNIFNMWDGKYTDKKLERIDKELRAEPFEFHSLNSLASFLADNNDLIEYTRIIKVEDERTVSVYSPLNGDRKREVIARAVALTPDFGFERFMDTETFIIATQAKFLPNEDLEKVQNFAGTVQTKTVNQYSDDGISQSAVVKTGIASKDECIVPNPVTLRPFRTFTEVEQPESRFVFRLKDGNQYGAACVLAALFEADGGAWKLEAMKNIGEYLRKICAEKEVKNYTIVS